MCLDELAAVRWVLFLGASLPVTRPLAHSFLLVYYLRRRFGKCLSEFKMSIKILNVQTL